MTRAPWSHNGYIHILKGQWKKGIHAILDILLFKNGMSFSQVNNDVAKETTEFKSLRNSQII